MRDQKNKHKEGAQIAQNDIGNLTEQQFPIVASARTGLAAKDDAIMRRIPADYSGKTVKQAIDYIVDSNLADNELSLGESIKSELGSRGSVVVVNGKSAKLEDNLEEYLVTREHKLPDKTVTQYRELEIEVSSVQQGGLYELLK